MLVYSQAALFDPRHQPKVVEAASSAVQLIHLIVDINCEPLEGFVRSLRLDATRLPLPLLARSPVSQLDTWLIVPWIHQARALAFAAKALGSSGQGERESSVVER